MVPIMITGVATSAQAVQAGGFCLNTDVVNIFFIEVLKPIKAKVAVIGEAPNC